MCVFSMISGQCECVCACVKKKKKKDRPTRLEALHFDSQGIPARNKSPPMGAIVQTQTPVIGQRLIRWYTSPLYSVAPHNRYPPPSPFQQKPNLR